MQSIMALEPESQTNLPSDMSACTSEDSDQPAYLSLCSAHVSDGTFFHALAHLFSVDSFSNISTGSVSRH